ncbi:hypothetical protein CDCA_CDCA03G0832 [Cyanidium caldarium]|uniref:Uncharacterized protein n=1 Tax=Cyanidium caldarium TaxID=2771 RepID=A0AAV9IR10_CYACA|nr:hypothetical protein CDCA_CDCA03G0832 [Cyanidium caldarium]
MSVDPHAQHAARVRWRCTQPPLHVARCGDASQRPAPNTPAESVDWSCWLPCHACHGTTRVMCPHCDGEGVLPVEEHFVSWLNEADTPAGPVCAWCRGSGTEACAECQGHGYLPRWNQDEARQME